MTALDDLKTAVANVQSDDSAVVTLLTTQADLIAKLQVASADTASTNAELTAMVTELVAVHQSLTAALSPPSTSAPGVPGVPVGGTPTLPPVTTSVSGTVTAGTAQEDPGISTTAPADPTKS